MSLRIKAATVILMLVTNVAFSQTDSLSRSIRYYNTFLSGSLIGCNDCSGKFAFSFTTFHGVSFKSGIKVGLGLGLDIYNDWQMVPLLAGITFDKGARRNALFLHLNGGYSFGKYVPSSDIDGGPDITDKGGFTINPMVGFRMGKEKLRVYVQAGYKYQYGKVSIDYQGWWGWPLSHSREYDLNRFVLQLGFGLN